MATTDKPVTVRLPLEQLRDLQALSLVDNSNLAQQVRSAISQYIQNRVSDSGLKDQIQEAGKRYESTLESLRAH
ncbi:hypothetical protein [Pseudoclavibacter sp. VKM Ac-2867]|uniref:hypothetical protein n=1 Tax=Pseudoclavibacter sp. VKM Ac-2867 TaxID=2783829 RepID=UPI00188AD4BD|nr:hypothetical protein [Pseudoclavibacter sp. VKM Ac-2867]MBF4459402.1 hypothetical protein [Pseudoclavibacter sp. VKM Ac-2867]